MTKRIDSLYLTSVILITVFGFVTFFSASFGLLVKDDALANSVLFNQSIGLLLGTIAFFVASRVNYLFYRKHALAIFAATLCVNVLLFIPSLTLTHGGASRWLDFRYFTIQPSELLKIGFIIYLAGWLAFVKTKIESFKFGIIPFLCIIGLVSILLLAQSDTDTLVVIGLTGITMLFVAGAKMRHIGLIGLLAIIFLACIVLARPYAKQRVMTYLNPNNDPQGSSYQIQQSLIAIGSGGLTGRGFGQSIQKFSYLPEPVGDSIFAVAAEEFGFIGMSIMLCLYVFFVQRTFKIAARAPDTFSRLVVLGIGILVVVESFMNISAMLGVIPLTGQPLLFVSHGGTALAIILGASGIIANISRYQQR
ncbi:MAG: cell division protein FtsW [Candidatus Pacebacteria bacterium]|jgi:cell division protein FtsW|nr:cell division protein FtsW [Candidatus Paceibacterota bacterium]